MKLGIEICIIYYCIKFFKKPDDKITRKGIMKGFKIYLGHIFFEGFKCSWFLNFYTRMMQGTPAFDENGEEIVENMQVIENGIKHLYIFG